MKIDPHWQAELNQAAAALAQAHAERDAIIVEADRAGVPKLHIAEGVSLSAMQVHRILKAAKD